MLFFCIISARNDSRFPKEIVPNKFNDQIIKQLLNSVFAKYRDLSIPP